MITTVFDFRGNLGAAEVCELHVKITYLTGPRFWTWKPWKIEVCDLNVKITYLSFPRFPP